MMSGKCFSVKEVPQFNRVQEHDKIFIFTFFFWRSFKIHSFLNFFLDLKEMLVDKVTSDNFLIYSCFILNKLTSLSYIDLFCSDLFD